MRALPARFQCYTLHGWPCFQLVPRKEKIWLRHLSNSHLCHVQWRVGVVLNTSANYNTKKNKKFNHSISYSKYQIRFINYIKTYILVYYYDMNKISLTNIYQQYRNKPLSSLVLVGCCSAWHVRVLSEETWRAGCPFSMITWWLEHWQINKFQLILILVLFIPVYKMPWLQFQYW